MHHCIQPQARFSENQQSRALNHGPGNQHQPLLATRMRSQRSRPFMPQMYPVYPFLCTLNFIQRRLTVYAAEELAAHSIILLNYAPLKMPS